jgi:hypothetical protein
VIVLNLFNDPTPTGIINQRLVTHVVRLYAYTDLTEEEKKDLSGILYFVGMKLVAVWRHLNNYRTIEDRLIREAQGSTSIEKQAIKHIRYEQDLFLELDEFLVQLKSSLDYLVKIPRAIVGRNVWSLSTFHKKGDAVVKALRGSLPDKYKEKAKIIEETVVQHHLAWLADTINARDMINHYLHGGLDIKGFTVVKAIEDGKEKIRVPMRTEDLTVRSYMEIAWANLFKLTEDFIISFLALRLKAGYTLLHTLSEHTAVKSPWKIMPTADYETLIATEGWESQVNDIRCLTEYRDVLTNELVSEKRTLIVAIPCKDGLVICADKKLNLSIGGCTLEDAVKIHKLSTQVAFGVVGNSIFYDPLNPLKVLYSTENVVKAFFANKKYIPDDWSEFARTVTQSFTKFATDLPPTYIVSGGPPPDHFIFHIVFWYLKPDGRLGAYTFSLQYIREIGRLCPFRMEEPAQTFEIGRALAWGNVRLFDEITNGSESRFDELRNDAGVRRLLVEDPPASEVTVEEALTAANKLIKVSRTMTSTLEPIKEAADIEEKTVCAIINRQTGFKWLSEESEPPAIRKLPRQKKKRRK